jgi:hypothetical protein
MSICLSLNEKGEKMNTNDDERMVGDSGRAKYLWLIIVIMSIAIIFSSVFFMIFPEITFDISMEYPGSPLTWERLDERSKVGMRFLIVRPFWDEILYAILGLFTAWGLKKRVRYAWNLGVFWSFMMLMAGIALGLSELLIGKWPTVCVVTILYSLIGVVALIYLFIVKKEYINIH